MEQGEKISLKVNSLIFIKQFGFCKNRSTADAFSEVTETFRLDLSKSVKRTVSIDFKKLSTPLITKF